MAAPITTTQTTQSMSWTDAEGSATATINVTNEEAPVLFEYFILNTTSQNMLAFNPLTTAQLTFVNQVFTDILAALNPNEE